MSYSDGYIRKELQDEIFLQGLDIVKQGNYDQAIDLIFQKSYSLCQNKQQIVTVLYNCVQLFWNNSYHDMAEFLLYRAIEFTRKEITPDHHIIIQSLHWLAVRLNSLALNYFRNLNYAKSEEIFLRALNAENEAHGKKNADYAIVLKNLGVLYYALRNDAKAKQHFMKSKEIFEKVGLPNNESYSGYAEVLNALGLMHMDDANYVKAKQHFMKSKEIFEKVVGTANNRDYAAVMVNIGEMYRRKSEYIQAERCVLQSKEIFEKIGLTNDRDYAKIMVCLGNIYLDKDEDTQAEKCFLQSKEIFEKIGLTNDRDYAINLIQLGSLYEHKQDYKSAENYCRDTLDIFNRLGLENDPDYAFALNLSGKIFRLYGVNLLEVERIHLKSKEIFEKIGWNKHPHYAANLNNLALLYTELSQFDKAEKYFNIALDILGKTIGKNTVLYAILMSNLGQLYGKIGDNSKALRKEKEALKILRKALGNEHPEVLHCLNNLVSLALGRDDIPLALIYLTQIPDINKLRNTISVGIALENLAEVNRKLRQYEIAERLYVKSQNIYRSLLSNDNIHIAINLNNLSVLYLNTGDYHKAESLLSKAKEICLKVLGSENLFLSTIHTNFTKVYMGLGRPDEALKEIRRGLDIDNKFIEYIFSTVSNKQRLAFLNILYAKFYLFLSIMLYYRPEKDRSLESEALELVFRRKGIVTEALAMNEAILRNQYPELSNKIKDLFLIRNEIGQKLSQQLILNRNPEVYQNYLSAKYEQIEHLEKLLVRQIPKIRFNQITRSTFIKKITDSLNIGVVLIEYVKFYPYNFKPIIERYESEWNEPHYVAFVLDTSKPEDLKITDLGNSDYIDKMIFQVTTWLKSRIVGTGSKLNSTNSELESNNTNTASTLRTIIFDQPLKDINNCSNIIIAPDGDLNRLPFEILPTSDGKRYLIDDYSVSYISTGRDVLHFGNELNPSKYNDSIVAADPDFDLGNNGSSINYTQKPSRVLCFPPLRGTHIEGEVIADMLGVQPLLEERVTEFRLKNCKSPAILHIATHGFFDPDNIIDIKNRFDLARIETLDNSLVLSGLALAGANTWSKGGSLPKEAEDGILNALDVSCMNLTDTELVVLSACDTALGQIQIGEGVFGLRRSFVSAGAKTLIMSLWKVPDNETRELMILFYEGLLGGEPRSKALRRAQLAMKEKYPSDPEYWGPFICQGDPGPLSECVFRKIRQCKSYTSD